MNKSIVERHYRVENQAVGNDEENESELKPVAFEDEKFSVVDDGDVAVDENDGEKPSGGKAGHVSMELVRFAKECRDEVEIEAENDTRPVSERVHENEYLDGHHGSVVDRVGGVLESFAAEHANCEHVAHDADDAGQHLNVQQHQVDCLIDVKS